VIDADAVHLTDTDGADILIQVARELHGHSTTVALARVHPPTLDLWRRAGLSEAVGEDDIFASVHDAVDALTSRRRSAPDAVEPLTDRLTGNVAIPITAPRNKV
jgi:MFS superfamily sulfate permease-like transporter